MAEPCLRRRWIVPSCQHLIAYNPLSSGGSSLETSTFYIIMSIGVRTNEEEWFKMNEKNPFPLMNFLNFFVTNEIKN